MKFSSSIRSGRSGFTLVELLVVIGIIAILASVVFSVGNSAIKAAQRAKVAQMANSIQTAVVNYYSEYNVYPVPAGTPTGDYLITDTDDGTNWKPMLVALCGNIDPSIGQTATSTVPNTRNIAFMNLKAGDLVKNGAAIQDSPNNPLAPTGHPTFNLAIDNDYDNIVGDSGTALKTLFDPINSKSGNGPGAKLPNGTSGGVALWIDCNGSATKNWNPSFVIHTY